MLWLVVARAETTNDTLYLYVGGVEEESEADARARADVARYAPANYPDGEPVQPEDVDVTVTAIAAVLEQTACDLLDFEHFESEFNAA